MKGRFMYYLFLLMLFFCTPYSLNAYIYRAVVMQKKNDLSDRDHYFIGLGDYHHNQRSLNQKQREQFESMLFCADGRSLKLCTEDLSEPNVDGKGRGGKFYVNSRGGFLGGITQKCRDFNIDIDNVEYRYARVCSLGPVLNNRDKKPHSFPSVANTSVGDVVNEISYETDRIVRFDDGPLLNDWYRQCIERVDKKITTYGLTDGALSMADYLTRKKNSLPLIKKLLIFDRELLDAKIVHEVINNQDKERICVLAGGSHIERVSNMLKKVGYRTVLQLPEVVCSKDDIDSCVQSEQAVSEDTMPDPINLDRLRRFF